MHCICRFSRQLVLSFNGFCNWASEPEPNLLIVWIVGSEAERGVGGFDGQFHLQTILRDLAGDSTPAFERCLLKTETLKPTPFLTSCRLVQLREDQGFGEGRQDKGKAAEPRDKTSRQQHLGTIFSGRTKTPARI